ncbi:MAG: tRNA (guanosine(37)-N1)-methyltransferase TrmD [Verrucomicrobia bacterium]|nr:tRNA (guanosine(37)-N1)-methyltransferase TrmD [Verrucomicrobiota bacterium]
MRIDLLSLFPEYFRGPLDESMLRIAREKGLIDVRFVDIRDFAEDKHRRVDDRPYGGGPGMVMMPGPVAKALDAVRGEGSYVIHLTPQGERLTPSLCKEFALKEHLIFLCGHYEGIDERALGERVDKEVSIGDYVLTNGCLAALVVLDASIRYLPGVLGHEEAALQDSFEQGIFDYPQYTRPEVFEGKEVPLVLRSGNHAEIAQWRRQQALKKTALVRPDLKERR